MNIVWVETADQRAAWDKLVSSHPAGTAHLLSWYLDHQRFPRTRIDLALAELNNKKVGGAALYTFRLPLPGRPTVCLVPSGPLACDGREKTAKALIEALTQRAKASRAMLLQFEAFEPTMRDTIRGCFEENRIRDQPVWKLYHPTLWRELRVDLRGKNPETLLAGFTPDTRRLVKHGMAAEVAVELVKDDAGINEVYELWVRGGDRKAYTIRPRENFISLAHAMWERDAGVLLIARLEGRPAAFVHIIYFGSGAMYMYGAHDPDLGRGFAHRYLHYRAMCMAIERGLPYYSMAGPSTGGVRYFKEGFGPSLVDNMRFVSVLLRPKTVWLLRGLIGQGRWIQQAKRWASRSMKKRAHA